MKKLSNLKSAIYISIIISLTIVTLILYSALTSHNYCNYFCKDFDTCSGFGTCSNLKILDPLIILFSIFIVIGFIFTIISYVFIKILPNKYKNKFINYYSSVSNITISLKTALYSSMLFLIFPINNNICKQ